LAASAASGVVADLAGCVAGGAMPGEVRSTYRRKTRRMYSDRAVGMLCCSIARSAPRAASRSWLWSVGMFEESFRGGASGLSNSARRRGLPPSEVLLGLASIVSVLPDQGCGVGPMRRGAGASLELGPGVLDSVSLDGRPRGGVDLGRFGFGRSCVGVPGGLASRALDRGSSCCELFCGETFPFSGLARGVSSREDGLCRGVSGGEGRACSFA